MAMKIFFAIGFVLCLAVYVWQVKFVHNDELPPSRIQPFVDNVEPSAKDSVMVKWGDTSSCNKSSPERTQISNVHSQIKEYSFTEK